MWVTWSGGTPVNTSVPGITDARLQSFSLWFNFTQSAVSDPYGVANDKIADMNSIIIDSGIILPANMTFDTTGVLPTTNTNVEIIIMQIPPFLTTNRLYY
jgi:hypothetical protein